MNKQNKIYLAIGIIAIILIAGIIYLAINNSQEETIKIGVIGHLSGEYADYCIPLKNSIELAVEETNNAGGINGKKLVLVVEDDETDSAKAATAINKLIGVDKVNYVISVQSSKGTAVITPIANTSKKFHMIALGTAPDLTKGKEYVFRSIPSDDYQANIMAKYINENLKPKNVAGIYLKDAYGTGLKNVIESKISANFVASELFDPQESDFTTHLTKIKQANPEVLIIVGDKESYINILKQAKELGIKTTYFTSETFYDKDTINKIGADAEGIYTIFPEDPIDYANYYAKYKNKYGTEPISYGIYAYDGALSVIETIKKAGNNVEKAKTDVLGLSFKGASGDVGFDKEGNRIGVDYTIYKVENGKFVSVNN